MTRATFSSKLFKNISHPLPGSLPDSLPPPVFPTDDKNPHPCTCKDENCAGGTEKLLEQFLDLIPDPQQDHGTDEGAEDLAIPL